MNAGDGVVVVWALVDAAASITRRARRATLYARIGAVNQIGSVEVALKLFVEANSTLPLELQAGVSRWLDAYVGSAEEPRLRRLLKRAARSDPARTSGDELHDAEQAPRSVLTSRRAGAK